MQTSKMATETSRGVLGMGSNVLVGLSCTVHPVVLAIIVDSYERRNEDAKRAIGTLLGNVDKGVVEITNCFTVPHNESEDEVAVDIEFAKNMFELHKKVNSQEVIVGWYSTGHDIIEHSVLIHDYYMRECKNPVHMTVDTTLRNHRMAIKAYVSLQVGVPDKTQGTVFTPIPIEIVCQDQERVGLNYLVKCRDKSRQNSKLSSELCQLSDSCTDMVKNLAGVLEYVDCVVEGKIPSDPQVGRMLMELVNSASMSVHDFSDMVNMNKKDLLMMAYLGNLAKTQLLITEKLNQL